MAERVPSSSVSRVGGRVLNATDRSAEERYELASVIEQQAERLLDAARGAWLKLAELVDPTTGRLTGAPRGNRARSGGVCFSHAAAPARPRDYGDRAGKTWG